MEEHITQNETDQEQVPKKKSRYGRWMRLTALALVIAILLNLTSVDFSLLRYQGTDQMTAAKYLMDSTSYLGQDRLQRLKSLLTNVDGYSINLQAAEIAISKMDYIGAAKFLEKCIPLSPDKPQTAELYNRLGCVYMLAENPTQALQAFDSSVALGPENPVPYLLRAQLRYQNGDIDGALQDAQVYLKSGGSDSEMLMTAASICELGGDLDGAVEALTRQLQEAPENTDKALAYAERGRIHYLMGMEQESTEDIRKAKRVNAAVLTGVHYAIAGLCEYNAGDYTEGGKDFLRAAQLSEEGNAEYYEQAIMCGYLSNNYDFIKQTIEEAESKDMMTANALLIEGILLFSEERYEEAETAFSEAIDTGTLTVGTYYYRGLTRLALGNFENAADDFTEALKWEEDKDSCIFNRGVCYAALGENEKAREDLQYIVENAVDESLAASAQELLVTFQE